MKLCHCDELATAEVHMKVSAASVDLDAVQHSCHCKPTVKSNARISSCACHRAQARQLWLDNIHFPVNVVGDSPSPQSRSAQTPSSPQGSAAAHP